MEPADYPELELVGGALAEWPSGQGPRGETIAPAVFVDAEGHDALLALPHQFHAAGAAAWDCVATWQRDPPALEVRVQTPVSAGFRVVLDPAKPGRVALIEAILRDGALYICPTSPKLGLNARLARDHSFFCAVDRSFADEWRQRRPLR
ncbi:MAG: hypothetical protein HYX51_04410 [Chloroflexi bacterium]|nr:hypothetical protein [Chloroflexota bacterium]